jgi:hypothetical protein
MKRERKPSRNDVTSGCDRSIFEADGTGTKPFTPKNRMTPGFLASESHQFAVFDFCSQGLSTRSFQERDCR